MSAALLIARQRGRTDIVQQFGFFIVLNLVLTFSASNISVGGHIGGLVAGALVGALVAYGERRGGQAGVALEVGGMAAIAIASVAIALTAAASSGTGVT